MNLKENQHYQNQYGQQLKDFIIANDPEFRKIVSNW